MEYGATQHPSARPEPQADRSRELWRASGVERPVFADPSGRRGRAMSGLGLGIIATALASLAIVVSGAVGFGGLPALAPLIGARTATHPVPAVTVTRRRTAGHVLLARLHPVDNDGPQPARAGRYAPATARAHV